MISSLRARLGDDVEVSAGKTAIFLYASTRDAVIQAEHAVDEVLAQHDVGAGYRLERWDPVAEEWREAAGESPDEAEEAPRDAHELRMQQERQESVQTGRAAWQVRVDLRLHGDVKALARLLAAGGWPVVRRRRYLIAGADCEDDANALAEEIRGYTPADAVIRVQRGVYGLPGSDPGVSIAVPYS